LWPLSRRRRPKQLLRLLDGRSLIQETIDRLGRLIEQKNIYIIALAEHLPAISEQASELPAENLIGEPAGRDTAAAVALSAAVLHRRDPETVMGVFTADHRIRPQAPFLDAIETGFRTAELRSEALITFGIQPTHAHTGLGYLHRGEAVESGVWRVRSFKEKPDAPTAEQYVSRGEHFWNSGMFVWRSATILEALQRYLPATAEVAEELASQWPAIGSADDGRRRYESLQRISIDYAVMEKASDVLMIPMAVEWSDVGNWSSLREVLGVDANGNTSAARRTIIIDGHDNILVSESDHLISAVGVRDLIVVHCSDATLICDRRDEQRIKELVARLEREGMNDFL
jgi:mannose-1-phosphate guanylyltransferase